MLWISFPYQGLGGLPTQPEPNASRFHAAADPWISAGRRRRLLRGRPEMVGLKLLRWCILIHSQPFRLEGDPHAWPNRVGNSRVPTSSGVRG